MRRTHYGLLLALAALVATPGSAELFRCTGPDGKTIFTDQQGACPDADPYEPSGVVHSAPSPSKGSTAAVRRRRDDSDRAAEEESKVWRQKKRDAQARIDEIQRRRVWMKPYVTHCNRGGYVTTRDDAGIQDVVNCSRLRHEFAALDKLEAEANDYLVNVLGERREALESLVYPLC
jgi:hypothetical protein